MKKNILFSCVLLIVLILSLLYYPVATRKIDLRNKQEVVAKSLEVNIEDYVYPMGFPIGYFYSVLKPGMPYDEVHSIVRGYEGGYRCYAFTEIYYYFSVDDNDAIRFRLTYDDQGRYTEMDGEDPDSRTLGLGPGCLRDF
jgi:YD repeat-containing protein